MIEFRIVFTKEDSNALIARIGQFEAVLPSDLGEALAVPAKVDAHDVVGGWCVFELPTGLLGDKAIESYEVEFHDTHGLVSTVAPRIVQIPSGTLK